MKKLSLALALFAVLGVLVSGCGPTEPKSPEPIAPPATNAPAPAPAQ